MEKKKLNNNGNNENEAIRRNLVEGVSKVHFILYFTEKGRGIMMC